MNDIAIYLIGFATPFVLVAIAILLTLVAGLFSVSSTSISTCPNCDEAGAKTVERVAGEHRKITDVSDNIKHEFVARFNRKHRESWQRGHDKNPWRAEKYQKRYGTR